MKNLILLMVCCTSKIIFAGDTNTQRVILALKSQLSSLEKQNNLLRVQAKLPIRFFPLIPADSDCSASCKPDERKWEEEEEELLVDRLAQEFLDKNLPSSWFLNREYSSYLKLFEVVNSEELNDFLFHLPSSEQYFGSTRWLFEITNKALEQALFQAQNISEEKVKEIESKIELLAKREENKDYYSHRLFQFLVKNIPFDKNSPEHLRFSALNTDNSRLDLQDENLIKLQNFVDEYYGPLQKMAQEELAQREVDHKLARKEYFQKITTPEQNKNKKFTLSVPNYPNDVKGSGLLFGGMKFNDDKFMQEIGLFDFLSQFKSKGLEVTALSLRVGLGHLDSDKTWHCDDASFIPVAMTLPAKNTSDDDLSVLAKHGTTRYSCWRWARPFEATERFARFLRDNGLNYDLSSVSRQQYDQNQLNHGRGKVGGLLGLGVLHTFSGSDGGSGFGSADGSSVVHSAPWWHKEHLESDALSEQMFLKAMVGRIFVAVQVIPVKGPNGDKYREQKEQQEWAVLTGPTTEKKVSEKPM